MRANDYLDANTGARPKAIRVSAHRDHARRAVEGRRLNVLNRYDRPSPMAGEAEVKFLDGDFRIVRPGAFVRCAVTGVPIPIEELKYWSVDLQEAYASPDAVLRRSHPDRMK